MKGNKKKNEALSPRETMRGLGGKYMQAILTEVTGRAHEGQAPLFRWTWQTRLLLALFTLGVGVTGSIALAQHVLLWALLPVPWLLTVSALRAFQTTFVHHASHHNLTGRPGLDGAIAEVLSIVAWILPFSRYGTIHPTHHQKLALTPDPDLQDVVGVLGFVQGKTLAQYWRQLWLTFVSPAFHYRFLLARTLANLVDAPVWRRLAALGYLVVVAAIGIATEAWLELAIAWVFPVTVLYQIAGLLQVLTEHHWVKQPGPARVSYATLTPTRFFGEAVPPAGLEGTERVRAWTIWTARMLLIHLPLRLLVAPGDLTSHHDHHDRPRADWANHQYALLERQRTAAGLPPHPEHWGLYAALEMTFTQLSELDASAILGDPTTYRLKLEGYLTM